MKQDILKKIEDDPGYNYEFLFNQGYEELDIIKYNTII